MGWFVGFSPRAISLDATTPIQGVKHHLAMGNPCHFNDYDAIMLPTRGRGGLTSATGCDILNLATRGRAVVSSSGSSREMNATSAAGSFHNGLCRGKLLYEHLTNSGKPMAGESRAKRSKLNKF